MPSCTWDPSPTRPQKRVRMGHPGRARTAGVCSEGPGEAEVTAGHLDGELEVEEAEDGGGDIAEGASRADADFFALIGDE